MILDQQNLFSSDQAITASAASTNIIDLGATGTPWNGKTALKRDIGKGVDIPLFIGVTEDFATLTSLAVSVQVATDSAFTTPKTVVQSQSVPVAELVAGYQFNIDDFEPGTDERYLRLYYTVTGSNATAGKITAGVSMGNQTNP